MSPFAVPPAPSALWVSPSASNNVVRWNRVPGATTYYVYRGTAAGAEGATEIGTSTSVQYSDNTAASGTTYYYKVAASYGAAPGTLSAEASGQPGSVLLVAPIMSAKPTATGAAIAFSVCPGATFYDIFRYTAIDGYQRVGHVVGETNTNFADVTGIPGATYRYQVVAGNELGLGNKSNEMNAAAADTPAAAPSGIWANPNPATITLNWNKVPSAFGYIIYRGTSTGGETNRPFQYAYGTSATVNGTAGTTYYFKVAAIDNSGLGEMSSEAVAMVGGTRATAPLVTGNSGPTSITVRWTPIAGATLYRLFKVDNVGSTQQYSTYGAASSSATDTAVTAGVTYRYYVAASTTDGTGNTGQIELKAGAGKPDAPTLIASYPSGSANFIYWKGVPGATRYNIYRSTTSGAEVLLYKDIYYPYYYDYAITSGVRYFYKVRTTSNSQESNFSPETSSKAAEPRLPAPVTSLNVVGGQIQISIGAVAGATSYDILRSEDGGNNFTFLKTGHTSAIFTDATAEPATYLIYRVCAKNGDGEGILSNYMYGIGGNIAVPAPATTIAFASSASINVQCAPSPGADKYNLYRSTTPTMPSTPFATNVGTSYTDGSVVAGTRYYYAFVAVMNYEGESALSPVCSAKAGSTVLPAATLTLNQASSTSLLLNWTPISGSTGYDVYRTDGSSGYQMIRQDLPAPTLTDTGLTAGVQYTYYLYAVGPDGAGSRSNQINGVPGSTRLPTPTNAIALAYSTNTLQVQWNIVDGANYYNIYRSTSSGGEGAVPIALNVYSSGILGSYYDYNVLDGIKYYYKVTATDFHGQSLMSNEASARVNSARLMSTTASLVEGASMLTVNWTAVAGAASYTVYRQESGTYGYKIVKIGSTGTTYNDATVVPGAYYYYLVAATNSNGVGFSSNTVGGSTP